MDDYNEIVRLLLYFIGAAFALLLAGRLISGKHVLSRMFGGTMIVWAFNCVTFGLLLLFQKGWGELPQWTCWLRLSNAALLALAPFVLVLWFARRNHHGPD